MSKKLEISELQRGGIELTYDHDFYATIYVDALKCISIMLSYDSKNLLRYDICHNYDTSADFYIEYIKNNLDNAVFDKHHISWAKELYKELLNSQAFRECLDRCIKNIPDDLDAEFDSQVKAFREEYEKIIKAARNKYTKEIGSLTAVLRNDEASQGFVGRSKYGLIDDEIEEQSIK